MDISSRHTPEPGRRFEWDLRLIREARGVDLEDIHHRTRIAMEILETFELNGLASHPHYNEVYIRALVRTYAEVVGLPREIVLDEFTKSREGLYRGGLAQRFLGYAPVGEPEPLEGTSEKQASARQIPIQVETGKSDSLLRKYGLLIAGGVGLLILLTGIIWFWGTGDSEHAVAVRKEPVSTDTLHNIQEMVAAPSRPVVGDTLEVVVLASKGKLEPLRVRADSGRIWVKTPEGPAVFALRADRWTPFWIEQGDSAVIYARHWVRLRGVLKRATLKVENVPWPAYPDTTTRLTITREQAAALLNLKKPS